MSGNFFVGKAGSLFFGENNVPYVRVDEGQVGNVVYGPYQHFSKNNYEITFEILIDDRFKRDSRNFCYIDVAQRTIGAENRIITKANVNSDFEAHEGVMSVTLPFSINAPGVLEFRLTSLGSHPFAVKYERKMVATGSSSDGDGFGEFYKKHSEKLKRLSLLGAKVSPNQNEATIEWMGVRTLLKSDEDIQILEEVFVSNMYKFASRGNFCVIDVGMNVGFASLYFARMPRVQVVHSFEPFSAPFQRALENIALNPELALKIKLNKIGLAGATENLDVPCQEGHTIGTSIRGHQTVL